MSAREKTRFCLQMENQTAASAPILREVENVFVSIIVLCFNQVACTAACWEALKRTLPDAISRELIFVDNASSDGTGEFLKKLRDETERDEKNRVRVLSNVENLGFAKACNQGARAAVEFFEAAQKSPREKNADDKSKTVREHFLLFLNNDTVPLAGWLEALLDALLHEPRAAIAGSKLLYPDGRVQHAGVVVCEKRPWRNRDAIAEDQSDGVLRVRHVHRLSHANAPWVNEPREFQVVTAACLMIRREVFFALDGFDEGFINGYEDVDLCFKARAAGHRILYCPQSVLFHYESVSKGRHAHEKENAARLSQRWFGRVQPDERAVCAAANRLEFFEVVKQVEEMAAFIARIDTAEKDKTQKDSRGFFGWLRKPLRRWLGIEQLAADVRTARSALMRAKGALRVIARQLEEQDSQIQRAKFGDEKF